MKALVVFYSRTGTTQKIAEAISKKLGCDIDEITDEKKREGPIGYFLSGRDAMLKKLTEIKTARNPADYDLVIIGTPVWAHTMSSAVRTYILNNKDGFNKLAFFITMGSFGAESTAKEMEALSGKRPEASLALTTKSVVDEDYKESMGDFLSRINGVLKMMHDLNGE